MFPALSELILDHNEEKSMEMLRDKHFVEKLEQKIYKKIVNKVL